MVASAVMDEIERVLVDELGEAGAAGAADEADELSPVAAFVVGLRTLAPPPGRAVADRQIARAAAAASAARGPLAEHEIGWGNGRTSSPRRTAALAVGVVVLLLAVVLLVARAVDPPDADRSAVGPPAGVADHGGQTIARLVPSSMPAPGSSFEADLAWMADRGISLSGPDGAAPSAPVSRQAMAAFVYRAAGRPLGFRPPCTGPFGDVPAGAPFCGEIAWLANAQVTTGYPDGTFRPAEPLDRRSLAIWLFRLSHPGERPAACSTAPFADVAADAEFCGEITAMREAGVATGFPDGSFRPAADVTRQAAAAFLRRFVASTPPGSP